MQGTKPIFVIFIIAFSILFKTSQAVAQENVEEIVIKAISGMQYDVVRFKVSPGARVTIRLINTDEMSHNLIVAMPGSREEIVASALRLTEQPNTDFIPESNQIISAIPLLDPDEEFTISFTAPEREGVYPYVCTYPGHGSVMYGAMYVTQNKMPPLANDQHIPEQRRNPEGKIADKSSGHPYPMIYPSMYRAFMPESGPASIAVGMLGDVSYCGDAGECRLRYLWKGGFLDMERTWSGKGKERADLVGVVFYREEVGFPIRIGNTDHIPEAEFIGYEMKVRYPTFIYELDGATVKERIIPTFDAPGIIRTFKVTNLKEPLWFVPPAPENVSVEISEGTWEGDKVRLTPEEAAEFVVTIKEKLSANLTKK